MFGIKKISYIWNLKKNLLHLEFKKILQLELKKSISSRIKKSLTSGIWFYREGIKTLFFRT